LLTWAIEELGRDEESSRVNDVQFSMPLTCAVQLGLVELLRDFGIQPAAVTGHSSGEVAAAFAAGALTLAEAMACTYYRGLINAEHIAVAEVNDAMKGGMLAVGMAPADLAPYLDDIRSGKVVIACINSPSSVTISGDIAGIQELKTRLEKENIFVRSLRVQAAFHSHHMLPLEDQYLAALQEHMDTHTNNTKRAFREHVLFVSPVTADLVHDTSQLGPQH
jgi:acyl transferase domain-containing protein